jgi:hypothetical protein
MYIFHSRKGTQESSAKIHRREKTSWKAQREIVKCSGQGWKEDVYQPLPPSRNSIPVNKYHVIQ